MRACSWLENMHLALGERPCPVAARPLAPETQPIQGAEGRAHLIDGYKMAMLLLALAQVILAAVALALML